MTIFNVLTLIGGLAMFLYGMNVMGNGLEKLAGGKLEKIFERLTSNPIKAMLLGLSVTAGNHSYGSRLRKLGNHASVSGCWLYYGRKYRYYRNSVDIVFVRT